LPAFAGGAPLPRGYGGVELGMSVDEVKEKLRANADFGYRGDGDVSLLPGENRVLIETDAESGHSRSFLTRCWFQFYEGRLYTIIINVDRGRMDHYSIFSALCEKYGEPESLTPEKSVWQDDGVMMSLERPLALKYVDKKVLEEVRGAALVLPSGSEMTRELFLEGL
ncbi:MAG: hypothetical protein K2H09_00005, partial [Treponemataceae bacterium]|nr:hypothetical protein [Treponemataceae bacterium]